MKERKHEAPPQYDAAFKEGAIRLVTQEGRPMRESLKNWALSRACPGKESPMTMRLQRIFSAVS